VHRLRPAVVGFFGTLQAQGHGGCPLVGEVDGVHQIAVAWSLTGQAPGGVRAEVGAAAVAGTLRGVEADTSLLARLLWHRDVLAGNHRQP